MQHAALDLWADFHGWGAVWLGGGGGAGGGSSEKNDFISEAHLLAALVCSSCGSFSLTILSSIKLREHAKGFMVRLRQSKGRTLSLSLSTFITFIHISFIHLSHIQFITYTVVLLLFHFHLLRVLLLLQQFPLLLLFPSHPRYLQLGHLWQVWLPQVHPLCLCCRNHTPCTLSQEHETLLCFSIGKKSFMTFTCTPYFPTTTLKWCLQSLSSVIYPLTATSFS